MESVSVALMPSKHIKFLKSLKTQLSKNIALTYLQHQSAKSILENYTDILKKYNIKDVESSLEKTKEPHRVLIKKPSIQVVDKIPDAAINFSPKQRIISKFKENYPLIEVMATKSFAENAITNILTKVDTLLKTMPSYNKYYFYPTPDTIYYVVDEFLKHDASVSEELMNLYTEYKKIHSEPYNYVPCIYKGQPRNIPETIKDKIKEIENDNLILIDRRWKYALSLIETFPENKSLSSVIAFRKEPTICLEKSDLIQLSESLSRLKRFPVLFVVDSENSKTASLIDEILKNFNKNDSAVALFRSVKFPDINATIKDSELNKHLTNKTQVVIISSNKGVPKLLYKDIWKPQAIVSLDCSYIHSTVKHYIKTQCDLQITCNNLIVDNAKETS